MYLISSCLVGVRCRYNGSCAKEPGLIQLLEEGKAIAVCPELLAKLETPRESCEIVVVNGEQKVLTKAGEDLTQAFKLGAEKTLAICKITGVETAILQSRSPSCGFGKIYDGTFSGGFIEGNGLTADLLHKNGIRIFNEDNWNTEGIE